MSRVIAIGIDGATFDLIRPWAERGDLPNLARLISEGAHGPLESTLPPVTSPAWPTFATGKNPGKHGVFDFIRPLGGQFELVNASSLRAPTLWEILSQAGRKTGIMNVPVTYPPSPVNGFVIGGMLSPVSGTFTYPRDFLDQYVDDGSGAALKPYRIAPNVQYKEGNEDAFLADLLDLVERRGQYALRLMDDHAHYDFLMFHFQATDVLQHALWKVVDPSHPRYDPETASRFAPLFKQIYQSIDRCLGQMLERVDDDVTVIVMSDHGFGPLHDTVNINLFLLEQGLLKLKRRVWTRLKAGLFGAGLTPASIWQLIERAGLQNTVWQVSKSTRNKVVSKFLSFDDVDWSQTLAYAIGHVGQVYINLKGREPRGIVEPGAEYVAVRQRVVDALKKLRHPQSGEPMVDQVIPGDMVVHGPYASRSADLHLVLDGYRAITFPLFAADRRIVTRQIRGDSGSHRRHGVLIAWGADVRPGEMVSDARLVDLTPTILHVVGLPVPSDMDGNVLTSMLTLDRPVKYEQAEAKEAGSEAGLSAEETAEVEERLRSLGYLG